MRDSTCSKASVSPRSFPPALHALCAAIGDRPDEFQRYAAEAEGCLAEAALRHGLTPFFYRWLRQHELLPLLSPAERQQLATAYVAELWRQQALLEMAADVAHRLTAARCPFLGFKGFGLLAALQSKSLPREMRDLDLLVPPAHLEDAVTILKAAGYMPERTPWAPTAWECNLPPLWRQGLSIDLHWRLWPCQPLLPFALPDYETLAQQPLFLPLGEITLPTPDLLHQFLIAAAHMTHDGFAVRLRHWADLYWLWQQLDAPHQAALWEQAAHYRMDGFIAALLRLLAELWPLPEATKPPLPLSEAQWHCLRTIVWRRLRDAPLPVDPYWLILIVRRWQGFRDKDDNWQEQLPPYLRAQAATSFLSSLLARKGGVLFAASRMFKRAAQWLFTASARRNLREVLGLAEIMHHLAHPPAAHTTPPMPP